MEYEQGMEQILYIVLILYLDCGATIMPRAKLPCDQMEPITNTKYIERGLFGKIMPNHIRLVVIFRDFIYHGKKYGPRII